MKLLKSNFAIGYSLLALTGCVSPESVFYSSEEKYKMPNYLNNEMENSKKIYDKCLSDFGEKNKVQFSEGKVQLPDLIKESKVQCAKERDKYQERLEIQYAYPTGSPMKVEMAIERFNDEEKFWFEPRLIRSLKGE